jgi:Protein of unknown function (DUF3050)
MSSLVQDRPPSTSTARPTESAWKAFPPERDKALGHPIYNVIDDIEDIRVFMESHVFAVWDFMSLLKRLQRDHTCVDTPWLPIGDAATRRLVNQIVLGEESDLVGGVVCSHFELYLSAMQEAGADTAPILRFVGLVRQGVDIPHALRSAGAPPAAARFVEATLETVGRASTAEVAAVFAYTREELIPEMFLRILARLQPHDSMLTSFAAYLERHIELDAGEHFPLAQQLVDRLCGDDEAKRSRCDVAVQSGLRARAALWDGVHGEIQARRAQPPVI